jgi:murein DD-endopeptidase MepM/ murein hydrolase activator NlpD
MAHSPARRNTPTTTRKPAVVLLSAAFVALSFGSAATAKDGAKSTDKAPDTKKPVGVASTVPSSAPRPIEAGDGNDGVNRDDDGQAFLGGSGWVCPVPGSTFRNDWGNPRSGGRHHEGTDMFAAMGSTVVAPVPGIVKRHEGGLAGLAFYLQGTDGVEYFGAHLSALNKVGPVRAGEAIAQVGDSGNARGGAPHLHFEIHPGKGTKTNPYPTLAAQCASVATVK